MVVMRVIVVLLSASAITVAASRGGAQDYPSKPLRIVTGGVGGGGDFMSRLFAPVISAGLGQPVIVDNRGSGFLPGQNVAQSPPDGYSVVLYGAALYIDTLMRAKPPYDPIRDFAPITLVSQEPSLLAVHPSLPVNSVKDLLALIKARPGELNYSTGNTGTAGHLATELFKSMTGANMVRIPYSSPSQQRTALLAGEIQMHITGAAAVNPHIKAGKVKVLGITTAKPSPLYPGVPTVGATVPGYEFASITAVWAPGKTPEPIIRRLNQEFVRAVNQADVKVKMVAAGQEIVASSPEEFGAWMKTDVARLSKLIKDAGIKAE